MYSVSVVFLHCLVNYFTKVKLVETVVTKCCPSTLVFHSQELILPLTITATKFEKLRRWEEPYMTVSFLAFASTIIFRLVYTPTCDKCDIMYLMYVAHRMILTFKICRLVHRNYIVSWWTYELGIVILVMI